jgi:hypothetical protein
MTLNLDPLGESLQINLNLSEQKLGDKLDPDDITIYRNGMVAFLPLFHCYTINPLLTT